jgi:predicted phosphoribosyltransferase
VRFKNRLAAGQLLAEKLRRYSSQKCVVLALPRGGVVTAAPIALALSAPLDLILVRKIGHPSSPEFAIAAVAEDGHVFKNEGEVAGVDHAWFLQQVETEQKEAQRRRKVYLGARRPLDLSGAIAIVVDDGIATGLTMKAAVQELRHRNPQRIVAAAAVAPSDTVWAIQQLADDVIVLQSETDFLGSIGAYYDEFPQVEDEEVVTIMRQVQEARQ